MDIRCPGSKIVKIFISGFLKAAYKFIESLKGDLLLRKGAKRAQKKTGYLNHGIHEAHGKRSILNRRKLRKRRVEETGVE